MNQQQQPGGASSDALLNPPPPARARAQAAGTEGSLLSDTDVFLSDLAALDAMAASVSSGAAPSATPGGQSAAGSSAGSVASQLGAFSSGVSGASVTIPTLAHAMTALSMSDVPLHVRLC
jgi:hypothetical protein